MENPGEKPDKQVRENLNTRKWITNVNLSRSNVIALANDAGRMRRKIENQAFNAFLLDEIPGKALWLRIINDMSMCSECLRN